MRLRSTLALATLVLLPATQEPELAAGTRAPELALTDLAGKPVRWSDLEGHAAVLFFHSASSRYSGQALEELGTELAKEPSLAGRLELVLVAGSEADARDALARLGRSSFPARACVDGEQRLFAVCGVIATPTAICVDASRAVAAVVKGYGTLFTFRVDLGARRAAGVLDVEAYQRALAGKGAPDALDAEAQRLRHAAGRLLAEHRASEAEALLQGQTERYGEAPWWNYLLGRCALEMKRVDDARARVAALERSTPLACEALALRARIALATDDLAAAEQILAAETTQSAEFELLRGMLLQARGEGARALATYRTALERVLLTGE
jgi:hypothetical protein